MNTIIAYYSWKGHTKKVAEDLGTMLGAGVTLVRIEPVKETSVVTGGMKAAFGMRGKIKPCITDMRDYDHLVIATPVWSHKIPPYTREYISLITGCEGKKFSVLAEMGGSGADNAIRIVRSVLEEKKMLFAASAATIEKDVDGNRIGQVLEGFSGKIRSG